MTRIAKLYAAILADPTTAIRFAEFEKLLSAAGSIHARTAGSHRHYTHARVPGVFTILPHGKGVKPFWSGASLKSWTRMA
ncbi:type II toxin-antitoxin system HicA family toxin [Sphingomonas sp.]|uniref:type II toxin-antitoxin system HicA family toxin n=1 Tax=Sphingomonas sp. TaxID=28214 RepID=UPI0035C7F402